MEENIFLIYPLFAGCLRTTRESSGGGSINLERRFYANLFFKMFRGPSRFKRVETINS